MPRAISAAPSPTFSIGVPPQAEVPLWDCASPAEGLAEPIVIAPARELDAAAGAPIPVRATRLRRGFGALTGSLLLHLAAIGALAAEFIPRDSKWILPMNRGTNSVELTASVAKPPPASDEPIVVKPPERTLLEPKPAELEPLPTVVKRALMQPERPSASFAKLKDDERLPKAPSSETRAEIEVPETSEAQSQDQPKRKPRPVAQALPREAVATTTEESVASAASVADAGAVSDQPPAIVQEVEPVYPADSRAAGEQGIVKILIQVDDTGKVVTASLYKSSGFPRLDRAALDVIYAQRFSPAGGGTRGRAAEFIWPFKFQLTDPKLRK